jgi:hypothetical protein
MSEKPESSCASRINRDVAAGRKRAYDVDRPIRGEYNREKIENLYATLNLG